MDQKKTMAKPLLKVKGLKNIFLLEKEFFKSLGT